MCEIIEESKNLQNVPWGGGKLIITKLLLETSTALYNAIPFS
jgi:hypothetical protein